MRSRVQSLFWVATAGAVLFLGALWSTSSRLWSPGSEGFDLVVLAVAGAGFVASAFVAGRIVVVTSRAARVTRGHSSRRERADRPGSPAGSRTTVASRTEPPGGAG